MSSTNITHTTQCHHGRLSTECIQWALDRPDFQALARQQLWRS